MMQPRYSRGGWGSPEKPARRSHELCSLAICLYLGAMQREGCPPRMESSLRAGPPVALRAAPDQSHGNITSFSHLCRRERQATWAWGDLVIAVSALHTTCQPWRGPGERRAWMEDGGQACKVHRRRLAVADILSGAPFPPGCALLQGAMLLTLCRHWTRLGWQEEAYLAAHGVGCLSWRLLMRRLARRPRCAERTRLLLEEAFACLVRLTVFLPAGTSVILMWTDQLGGSFSTAAAGSGPLRAACGAAVNAALCLLLLLFGTEVVSLALLSASKPVMLG